tara:strand:+ start:1486 stop:1725 length:240 start_codon:yes stop_codon:yes gene_type:complete
MEDDYLTVGALRAVIEDMPDETKVYYERIQDAYFDEYEWKPDKLIRTDYTEPEDNMNDEYIRAFCAFKEGGDLHITAHF